MVGMTLARALKEAKRRYGVELNPITARGWIAQGVLPGMISREGASSRGGVRGLYPLDMPIHIAVVATMKREGFKLEQIAAGRKKFESPDFQLPAGLIPWTWITNPALRGPAAAEEWANLAAWRYAALYRHFEGQAL